MLSTGKNVKAAFSKRAQPEPCGYSANVFYVLKNGSAQNSSGKKTPKSRNFDNDN